MTELWERDAWELADAVRAGDARRRSELLDVSLERIEARNDELNAVCYLDADGARGTRATEIDARGRRGERPGPVRRRADRGQGARAGRRASPTRTRRMIYRDDVAEGDCTEVARLRAARRGDRRAHDRARVRDPELHDVAAARHHPQPVEPRAHAGRLVGRLGRRGRGRAVPRVHRQRRRRLDPHPVVVLGAARDQAARSAASVTARTTRSTPGSRRCSGPMVRSVRDAARYLDVDERARRSPTRRRCRSREPYEPIVADVDRRARDLLRGKRVAWSSTLGYGVSRPRASRPRRRDAAEALIERPGLELVDVADRVPEARAGRGACSAPAEHGRLALRRRARTARRPRLPRPRRRSRGCRTCAPRHLGAAIRRRHEILVASAALFEQVDLLLTPTTPTTAYQAEGTLVGEVNGKEVDLMYPVGRRSPRRST